MMIALTIVSGLIALAWSLLAARLYTLSRGKWFRFLTPIEEEIPEAPSVDAVIPSRNEEANIASTVEALRAQVYPGLRITIVDDQSTDSTAAILDRIAGEVGTSGSLRIVRGVERPEEWVGKTWAVHQGAAGSTAEWLWFVDADMGLHPKALATALIEAEPVGGRPGLVPSGRALLDVLARGGGRLVPPAFGPVVPPRPGQ